MDQGSLFVASALRRRIVIPFSERNERATKDLTGNRVATRCYFYLNEINVSLASERFA